MIVDEFTGRLMSGRRWTDGLHQAVEAKEGVAIQAENQTMATITFQNYFRLYNKLSGMTGTADTEAYEFQSIYGLEAVVMPPNKPSKREDQLDRVYKTTTGSTTRRLKDIRECHERGQPVLVGTTSIENSEIIDQLLTKAGLPHQVLNAKQHDRGSRHHRPGRPRRHDHHCHQHGRPWYRHRAGRQHQQAGSQGHLCAIRSWMMPPRLSRSLQLRAQWQEAHDRGQGAGRPAHHRHRAPSVAPYR